MSLAPIKGSSTNPPSVNSLLQANPGDRISADKSEITPIVAVLSRQLPLPQSQQLAGQTAMVQVLKSGPGNQAELEFNGQTIPVKLPPGRNLTAGEMITVAFALNDKDAPGPTAGTSGTRKAVDVNRLLQNTAQAESTESESPSFVDRLSSSARMIGLLDRINDGKTPALPSTVKNMADLVLEITGEDAPGGKLTLNAATANAGQTSSKAPTNAPALPGQNAVNQTAATVSNPTPGLTSLIAQQVSHAVENSGLFYESHLQQWANGQRSTEQLTLEPQARFGPEQVISEKLISPDAIAQSVKLVSSQLAALDQSRVSIAMQGLFDKAVQVEIEPDTPQPDDPQEPGDAARPWVAKLKLDMAHLGEIHVKLRMVGQRCDILLSGTADTKKAIDPHWQDIQNALRDKGLQLTHGTIRTREDNAHG